MKLTDKGLDRIKAGAESLSIEGYICIKVESAAEKNVSLRVSLYDPKTGDDLLYFEPRIISIGDSMSIVGDDWLIKIPVTLTAP